MDWLFKYKRELSALAQGVLSYWQSLQPTLKPWASASVYAHLIHMDWQIEKRRLLLLWGCSLLAVCFTLATLVLLGGVALALSWQGPYFVMVCSAVIGGYALVAAVCIAGVLKLVAQGTTAFAASKHELAQALETLHRP